MKPNYLRVSDIIAPFSGIEFIEDRYLIPAADRGKRVHEYIENILKDNTVFVAETELQPYVNAFEDFWGKYSCNIAGMSMELEKRLYCEEKSFTGQLDCIITIDDHVFVCDWKTSSKKSISWDIQGAAYKYLLQQNGYQNVDDVLFVQLKKDGTFKTYKCYDHSKHIDIFFKCLELYKFFNMSKTRRKPMEEHENI